MSQEATPSPTATAVAANTAEAKRAALATVQVGPGGIELRTMADMLAIARVALASGLVPKELDTEAKIVVCLQKGMEVGMKPMESLSNICVINGRPSIWGAGVPSLLLRHGCRLRFEEVGAPFEDAYGWRCHIARGERGEWQTATFTVADAKQAGLWAGERSKGKSTEDSPWCKYPKDMLRWKALARASKLFAADALAGLEVAEDIIDISPPASEQPAMLAVPAEDTPDPLTTAAPAPAGELFSLDPKHG